MNKKMVLAALGIVALAGTYAFAGATPGSGVPGSIHDMTKYGALGSGDPELQQGRVCAYCHTPHHAITEGNDYLPLWSHKITGNAFFTPYQSATIDATIDMNTMMEGPSKLCMSCHDGSVAVDTHYAFTGGKTLQQDDSLFATPAVGKAGDLSNDHPIGFVYDFSEGGIAAGPVGVGGVGDDPTLGAHVDGKDEWIRVKESTYAGSNLRIADRLYKSPNHDGKGVMTCATCHDVHNKKNKDEAGATNYLLLASNKNSSLCLSCHIK